MNKTCIICKKEFIAGANNQKTCTQECRKTYGYLKEKKRYEISSKNSRKVANCKFCEKLFEYHFRKERGERIYCSRSCASKSYIISGAFDKWRLRKNPRMGEMKKCLNPRCNNQIYVEPRLVKKQKGKVCSFDCEREFFSQKFSGVNNPFHGKKHNPESLKLQKETLQKNYPGTLNAFSLAKKRTKTKPQIFIFNYLKNKFPNLSFMIEKRVVEGGKEYYADIVSFEKKLIVEFYGDYWHCHPKKYKEDFYHQKKKITAKEIWDLDAKRLETIASLGYKILIIWETNFKNGTWENFLENWVEDNAKENNINAFRSSVNNHSSADVKLGELLESRGTITTTYLETENVKVEKIELYDNQQPSSCEETLEKVQRLRSA